MANQGNHGYDKKSQPTWLDVATTIRAIEATYGGHVEVSIDMEGASSATGAMWIYAKLYRGWITHGTAPVDVVRGLWPRNDCREMPSYMFRLLHQLDHSADARVRSERGGGL